MATTSVAVAADTFEPQQGSSGASRHPSTGAGRKVEVGLKTPMHGHGGFSLHLFDALGAEGTLRENGNYAPNFQRSWAANKGLELCALPTKGDRRPAEKDRSFCGPRLGSQKQGKSLAMAKFSPMPGYARPLTGTAIVDGKISRSKFEKASYKLLPSNSNPSSAIQGAFYQTPRVLINMLATSMIRPDATLESPSYQCSSFPKRNGGSEPQFKFVLILQPS
ncbi:hypothetical protein P885DRAFT_59425 [Corynascus similis CBS 632.67]